MIKTTFRPSYTISLALIVLLIVSTADFAVAQGRPGIVGKQAPDFDGITEWVDEEGSSRAPVSIRDYRGKVVYLYFFQDWCPGCQHHGFPTLSKLYQEFGSNKQVAFLAIQTVFEGFSTNTVEKLARNQRKHNIPIVMGHDDGGKATNRSLLMQRYRTRGTPWAIIIDPQGKVVFSDFHISAEQAKTAIHGLLR